MRRGRFESLLSWAKTGEESAEEESEPILARFPHPPPLPPTPAEDVDELADDFDDEDPPEGDQPAQGDALATAPKKPKPKPPTERAPGQTLLPMSRVQKIMKADKELAGTAKEAVFLIAVATVRLRRVQHVSGARFRSTNTSPGRIYQTISPRRQCAKST